MSLFGFMAPVQQLLSLAQGHRSATLAWMTDMVAEATGTSRDLARRAVEQAVTGCEECLDSGEGFVFAVDQAVIVLGGNPGRIRFRPAHMHS